MSRENAGKKRFTLRQSDKVLLGIVAVMAVLIIALNILQRCGQSLINGALMLYLPILALLVLVGWGGYVLIRRIANKTVRYVVGGVLGVVLFLALMVVFTYVSFVASITVPQKYVTLKSPSGGHTLTVLRMLDPDEDRIEQRKAARLAENPDGDPDVTAADWGYVYKAYPQGLLGLFYRSNADVEGEVYLTYRDGIIPTSDEEDEETEEAEATEPEPIGTMMLEWLEDESVAHFYVENADVAEGGECTVRF